MIPPFVKHHELRLCAALGTLHPELERALQRVQRAFEVGLLPVDALLQQGLLTPAQLQAARASLPPQELTWGPFRIQEEVGRGAGGLVFKAHLDSGPEVALKLFRPASEAESRAQRFRREAQLLQRLEHPAIVSVHSAGEEAGQLYLATTWLGGGTLEDCGAKPLERALAWAQRLAGALAYAHEAGVLHRDLSPRNVVLNHAGAPVLVDFGLAKDPEGASLTGSQHGLGSPAYAAPEQLGAARAAGPACDAYGLTALLYFLLSGRAPFGTGSWSQLLRAIQAGPPPLSGPPELNALLRWGLDPDPRVRATLPELRAGVANLAS
jgi:eukaryotic-like serine/threonine-protein kinase